MPSCLKDCFTRNIILGLPFFSLVWLFYYLQVSVLDLLSYIFHYTIFHYKKSMSSYVDFLIYSLGFLDVKILSSRNFLIINYFKYCLFPLLPGWSSAVWPLYLLFCIFLSIFMPLLLCCNSFGTTFQVSFFFFFCCV